jgi:hypothetical protein
MSRLKNEWAIGVLAIGAFIWAIVASSLLFPFLTNNHDEAIYILQARLLAEGKLYFNIEEFSHFFSQWFFINDGEKIFAKYTPIHAGILAFGEVLFGSMRAVLGCIAAANVLIFYSLVREFGLKSRFALIATIFFTLSPIFLIQSATFLSYMGSLLFNMLFALLLLRGTRIHSMRLLVFSGLLLGISIMARPFDALLFAVPFTMIAFRYREPNIKHLLRVSSFLLIGLIPPMVLLLIINAVLTGNPLLLPFTAYEALDTLGFGPRKAHWAEAAIDFNMAKGILGVRSNLLQLLLWVFGGPIFVALGFLGIASPGQRFLKHIGALLLVVFPLAYIFFWGSYNLAIMWGGNEYMGPFYFIPMLVPLTIFGTLGLVRVAGWRPFAAVAIVIIMCFINIRLTLTYIERNYAYTEEHETIYQPFTDHRLVNALVFVPPFLGDYLVHPFTQLTNKPSLDGPILYALNKGNQNFDLLEKYPSRTPYQFVYEGLYSESPYDDIQTELLRIHLNKVSDFVQPLHITNPTDKPYVFTYVWNDGETATYLLDDSSQKGSVYDVTWHINREGATMEGSFNRQVSAISSLSDNKELTIAVAFANEEARETQDIFEWRFWLQVTEDDLLKIALPPEAWHNPGWPFLAWRMENIDYVMHSD